MAAQGMLGQMGGIGGSLLSGIATTAYRKFLG